MSEPCTHDWIEQEQFEYQPGKEMKVLTCSKCTGYRYEFPADYELLGDISFTPYGKKKNWLAKLWSKIRGDALAFESYDEKSGDRDE